MTIVYFFGPDGSGKSTLTTTLAKIAQERGYKVKLSWMRGSHTITSLVSKLLSRFDLFKGTENPYYAIKIPKKLRTLWQFLEFLGALPVIFGKFIIPSFLGYHILADRYVLDLAVWICLTTDDYDFLQKFEAKILVALTVKIRAKFYVFADVEKLNSRKDNLWLPQKQLRLYGKLAEVVGANLIDTTEKSIEQSLQEILKVIDTKKYDKKSG